MCMHRRQALAPLTLERRNAENPLKETVSRFCCMCFLRLGCSTMYTDSNLCVASVFSHYHHLEFDAMCLACMRALARAMCTNSCSPPPTKTYVPRTACARPRCCRRVRAHYPRARPEVRTASDTERMRAVGRDFAQVHSGRFFTRVHASFFGHGSKLCCEMCSTGQKKNESAHHQTAAFHIHKTAGVLCL